jgi:hypothetical protein
MVNFSNNNNLNTNINIFETQLNIHNFNYYKEKQKLHPYFVTGYTDGDGSFSIRIRKSKTNKVGFTVGPVYSIGAEANIENLKLLKKVQNFFGGVGSISKCGGNMYIYEVSSLKSLNIIINHFQNYPLETTKVIHFKLWTEIVKMMFNKEHLTKIGFIKILRIKSVFPKGLNDNIKLIYPKIKPIIKPTFVASMRMLNLHWISGFSQADSSFGLNSTKLVRNKLGWTFQPQFRITQHERDLVVLKRILLTLGCGGLVNPSIGRDRYTFSVSNRKDLINIIIPHFTKYLIYGAKLLDYNDFVKGLNIIRNKGHLSKMGLNKLKELALNMNSRRKF